MQPSSTADVRAVPVPVPASVSEPDRRWAAVLARDASADASFVYAVKTTGVYAPPSSAARLPRRENVLFFASAQEAEAAGYRPRPIVRLGEERIRVANN